MSKALIQIWGPIGIQSYGLFVALGIIIATWLFLKNPKRKSIISQEAFNKVLVAAIVSGLIGGRLLYILEDPRSIQSFFDIFKIWQGGLSSFGTVLAILITIPVYLWHLKVPIIRFLDLLAIYAPLVYAIARIGCFYAGCCYGIETNLPWGITYRDHTFAAPLYKTLHPTQLYSSIVSFGIFLLMYFVLSKKFKKTGQLLCSYLLLSSLERFSIDFLRGDRTFFVSKGIFSSLSSSGWISLLIVIASSITLVMIQLLNKNKEGSVKKI